MTIENDVRAASEKFYSALNRMLNGDAGPLGDIWSHSATGDVAYELGVERGTLTIAGQTVSNFDNRVTNIYRREVTGWKIVHHHTDLSPAMIDIVSRLQP